MRRDSLRKKKGRAKERGESEYVSEKVSQREKKSKTERKTTIHAKASNGPRFPCKIGAFFVLPPGLLFAKLTVPQGLVAGPQAEPMSRRGWMKKTKKTNQKRK